MKKEIKMLKVIENSQGQLRVAKPKEFKKLNCWDMNLKSVKEAFEFGNGVEGIDEETIEESFDLLVKTQNEEVKKVIIKDFYSDARFIQSTDEYDDTLEFYTTLKNGINITFNVKTGLWVNGRMENFENEFVNLDELTEEKAEKIISYYESLEED